MELPIELFLGGMGIAIALAIFGFLRQPQIPAMLCFGGMFMLVFAVATDFIIMNSFLGGGSDAIYHYNIQSSTGQVLINAVSAQTQAEFASASNSALVGDTIDCMTVWLGKAGIPPSGDIITFGVFDINNNNIKNFGQMVPTDMASSAITPYTMCLPLGETWTIQNGHRMGVRYAGGDAANTITMRVDGNNPFDGVITYRTEYTTMWVSSTGQDIMMQFFLRGQDFENVSVTYEFTELPKTLFALMGTIFILCGALMVVRNN